MISFLPPGPRPRPGLPRTGPAPPPSPRGGSVLHPPRGADADPVVEIGDVLVGHAKAARRYRLADGLGLVRAVDAIQRRAEIHGAGAQRIVDAARHVTRQVGAARDHLRRRGPAWPFLLGRDATDTAPPGTGP